MVVTCLLPVVWVIWLRVVQGRREVPQDRGCQSGLSGVWRTATARLLRGARARGKPEGKFEGGRT